MQNRILTLCSFASILLISLVINGCHLYSEEILRGDSQQQRTTSDDIVIEEHGLFPEGVAYDHDGHRFLVSSITRGTIGAVDEQGNYESFIEDGDCASTVGIEVDKARQRLLVCVSDPSTASVASLGSYDLCTGERQFLTDLTSVADGYTSHFANDVAVDQQGNAYVTDSFSPIIYKVTPWGEASVFLEDDTFQAPPRTFGLNGIVFNPNEFLMVASSAGVLYKIPMDNPQAFSTVATESGAVTSPDGLYLTENSQVMMVVNNDGGGVQGNMVALYSDDQWASAHQLDAFEAGPVFPTTVTELDDQFYVLYSHLDELVSGDTLRDTFTIMRVGYEDAEEASVDKGN